MRRFPGLIDPLLPKKLPALFLEPDAGDEQAGAVLQSTYAQAVIPGWVPKESRVEHSAALH